MLRIYTDTVTLLSTLRPVIAGISRQDRDLARQLRRAATSVLLNLAEGSGQRGGHRRERHRTALGSALEVRACIDAGVALGYVTEPDADLRDRLDKIVRTLVRLAR